MKEVTRKMLINKRSFSLFFSAVAICAFICSLHTPCGASENTRQTTKSIRVVYTNDTVGYLEPCSCGGRYLGGLSRRATAIADLVSENPSCLIVDSGNISNTWANLNIVADLMAQMRYDAVGIGVLDRNMADEFFNSTRKYGLKVIDTNTELSNLTRPYVLKAINGIKVGVVSYGFCLHDAASPKDSLQMFYRNYKTARDNSDLLILLDQGGLVTGDWQKQWGNRLGNPDIVIAGASKMPLSKEEIIGKTHIVPTSVQGRSIGVIDVEMGDKNRTAMVVRQITIDKSIPEDANISQQISDFTKRMKTLAAFYPANLNFGNVKKGTRKEEYVTLTPSNSESITISKAYSSGKHVSASEWKRLPDGSYKIKIQIDAGDTSGRVLETISLKLNLPDEIILDLLVFGNVVDE